MGSWKEISDLLTQKQTLISMGLAVVLVLLLVARTTDRSLDEALGERGIKIGYAVEPPYAYATERGEVTGQSPALAKRIAHQLGITKIEWIQTSFGALIADLESGRIDVIAAGLIITEARQARVAFSQPIFRVQSELLVRSGNPLGLHSAQDIAKNTEVQIAVLSGAMEYELLRSEGVADRQILLVPDAVTGLVSVQAGWVDGLMLTGPTIREMVMEREEVEMATPFETMTSEKHQGAFAFRKSSVRLRGAWERELAGFLETDDYLREMHEFGFSRDEVAGKRLVDDHAAVATLSKRTVLRDQAPTPNLRGYQ